MKHKTTQLKLLLMAILVMLGTYKLAAQGCPGYLTYSKGGWGGGAGSSYLAANFATAFPSGIVVGCAPNQFTFNTAAAVSAAIVPSSGNGLIPSGGGTNPATMTNTAAQTLAAMLSVGFDAANPNFAPASGLLGDLIIAGTGTVFDGMTVNAYLLEANKFLGGCATIGGPYTVGQITSMSAAINLNYDAGANLNQLNCPYVPAIITATVNGASCYGASTGSITINITSGGTAPFLYHYSGPVSGSSASNIIGGLPAGNYTTWVTDGAGLTSNVSAVQVTQPTILSSSIIGTNILCYGALTGAADLSVSGGVEPYTYAWSNGAITQDLSGIGVGLYSVTITDANGCSIVNSITINGPPLLQVAASAVDPGCYGGTGTLSALASGGTGAYTYVWANGVDPNAAPAGTYTVTVTDANGCTASASVTIGQPPLLEVSASSTDASCYGGTGTLSVSITGGTGAYSYVWADGADANAAPVGTYSVTVTDANGCIAQATTTIGQPSQLTAIVAGSDPGCRVGNGTLNASISGGTGAYTFIWTKDSVTVGTTMNLSGLVAGTYMLTVTDDNGCSITSAPHTLTLYSCTGYLTYTQGGWGSKPSGNNPGKILVTNWAATFGTTGAIIGSNGRYYKFTSAAAVDNFLPCSGNSLALPSGIGVVTNPVGIKNTLAGQTLALTISVKMDSAVSGFAPANGWLGNLEIGSGVFAGKTVKELLAIANNALGGLATGYSLSDINAAVDAINQNYDNGGNLNLLFCPCPVFSKTEEAFTGAGAVANSIEGIKVVCYPNPSSAQVSINIGVGYTSTVSVEIFNISGESVAKLCNEELAENEQRQFEFNGSDVRAGMYFCRITTSKETQIQKIMIAR